MAAASDGRAQLGQQVSGSLSQVPRTHELLPEVEGLALQARRHLQVRPAPLTVSLHHPSGTSHDFGKIEDDVARTFHASRGTHKPSTRSGNREFAAGPFSPQNATLRTKLARSTHPLSCTPPSATTTWGHPRASSRVSTTPHMALSNAGFISPPALCTRGPQRSEAVSTKITLSTWWRPRV